MRRDKLREVNIGETTNAGLWLDKYLNNTTNDQSAHNKAKKPLLEDLVNRVRYGDDYRRFYGRWRESLASGGSRLTVARVQSRLVLGLGDESVLETSVTLHRTYGVPVIPGSALKGTAAHFARNNLDESIWGKERTAYKIIFGTPESAGYITFFDALYVPDSGGALHEDVITPHHPEYYRGKGPPADWDSPIPVPFLSSAGSYLVGIAAPEADSYWNQWLDKTMEILKMALDIRAGIGIGAKTSSGYGRLGDWQAV